MIGPIGGDSVWLTQTCDFKRYIPTRLTSLFLPLHHLSLSLPGEEQTLVLLPASITRLLPLLFHRQWSLFTFLFSFLIRFRLFWRPPWPVRFVLPPERTVEQRESWIVLYLSYFISGCCFYLGFLKVGNRLVEAKARLGEGFVPFWPWIMKNFWFRNVLLSYVLSRSKRGANRIIWCSLGFLLLLLLIFFGCVFLFSFVGGIVVCFFVFFLWIFGVWLDLSLGHKLGCFGAGGCWVKAGMRRCLMNEISCLWIFICY